MRVRVWMYPNQISDKVFASFILSSCIQITISFCFCFVSFHIATFVSAFIQLVLYFRTLKVVSYCSYCVWPENSNINLHIQPLWKQKDREQNSNRNKYHKPVSCCTNQNENDTESERENKEKINLKIVLPENSRLKTRMSKEELQKSKIKTELLWILCKREELLRIRKCTLVAVKLYTFQLTSTRTA